LPGLLPGKIVLPQRWTSRDFNWRVPNRMWDGTTVKVEFRQKKRGYLPR